MYGVTYVLAYLTIWATSATALYQAGASASEAVGQVTAWMVSYFVGLYVSLIIYRSVLHPLNRFPGPFGSRMSQLWLSMHIKDRTAFRTVYRLHEEYGDFVRMGPSDLSISHPSATNDIYGPASKCSKAAWYDYTRPQSKIILISLSPDGNCPQHSKFPLTKRVLYLRGCHQTTLKHEYQKRPRTCTTDSNIRCSISSNCTQ